MLVPAMPTCLRILCDHLCFLFPITTVTVTAPAFCHLGPNGWSQSSGKAQGSPSFLGHPRDLLPPDDFMSLAPAANQASGPFSCVEEKKTTHAVWIRSP